MKKSTKPGPQSDHVYFNCNLSNNSLEYIRAKFYSNQTTAILPKADDYYLTIQRFYLPVSDIPLFIFNATPIPFVISLAYKLSDETIFEKVIEYDPSWNNTPIPFAVWNYQQFISYIQNAIDFLWNNHFKNPPWNVTDRPILMWNTSQQLFQFKFATEEQMKNYRIYMNTNLFNMFSTFPAFHLGNLTLPQNFLLANYVDNPNNYVVDPVTMTTGYVFSTEDNCQYCWNSLVRIILISGLLNVRSEYQYSATGGEIAIPILTDFEPIIDKDLRINNVVQFFPQAEFRRIDLISDQPVTKLDFEFYWEDKWGNTYPIFIRSGNFVSLKIMFEKKH